MEKPAEAGGAPLGGWLKLCEGDTRIQRILRAIIIIDKSIYIERGIHFHTLRFMQF